MHEENVLKTVAAYAVKHAGALKGHVGREGFYTILGPSVDEWHSAPDKTVYGEPLDILAETVEKGEFFGWWSSTVDASGNARVRPARIGESIDTVVGRIVAEDGRERFVPYTVEERGYLAPIRNAEGMRLYALAEKLGTESVESLKKATSSAIDDLFA